MAHKYIIDLTADEQEGLLNLITKGKPTARKVARAHVLLRADEGATDEEIAESLYLSVSRVHRTRQRFVEEGLRAALNEQPRAGRRRSLTGKQWHSPVALRLKAAAGGQCNYWLSA
jgi:putative transposase